MVTNVGEEILEAGGGELSERLLRKLENTVPFPVLLSLCQCLSFSQKKKKVFLFFHQLLEVFGPFAALLLFYFLFYSFESCT